MKKVLYYGGQKSGKSKLAEKKTLGLSQDKKPYYIATYDNSFGDIQMQERIQKHQKQRKELFILIEESREFIREIKAGNTYLVDCVSMWILNNLDRQEEYFIKELEKLSDIDANIVFVLNNLNEGVIPVDKISRKFIDFSGIIGQKLAFLCDEVYDVKLGLAQRLK
jgi:adenosylcobinamide kinase/adenosylcobinamide-phosphate guanylyltransferase